MSIINENILKTQKIRQSNHLIESPYTQEFSQHEIKIFEIAAAGISINDINKVSMYSNKKYYFSSKQLAILLNTSVSVISHEIEKTAARIMKKTIHLRKVLDDGSVEFEMINIIPYAKYKNGLLELDLNYVLIPYLVEVNKNFTEYQLHYLLSLRSAYSIKLYKLLYQYKKIKARTFEVDEIKFQLGIVEKYVQYKDFKKYVLVSSLNQINELTDLEVNYREIKIGRSVAKIEFSFDLKTSKIIEPKAIEIFDNNYNEHNDDIANFLDSELSLQTKSLILKYGEEKGAKYVESCINYAKRNAKSNLDKYLADTLTKGWAEVELKKSTAKKVKGIESAKIMKQEQSKRDQEREQQKLVKSEVEHAWCKLIDSEKQVYINLANHIIEKYSSRLTLFMFFEDKLYLSIYAVSKDKFYDRMLESYIKNVLKISLNIKDHLVV